VDRADNHGMQTQWVGPIWRSRRKDSRQRIARVGSWVDPEDVATGSVKPCDDDDLVADDKAPQPVRRPRAHLEPGVRRSLRSLFGRIASRFERGSDYADRPQSSGRRNKGV